MHWHGNFNFVGRYQPASPFSRQHWTTTKNPEKEKSHHRASPIKVKRYQMKSGIRYRVVIRLVYHWWKIVLAPTCTFKFSQAAKVKKTWPLWFIDPGFYHTSKAIAYWTNNFDTLPRISDVCIYVTHGVNIDSHSLLLLLLLLLLRRIMVKESTNCPTISHASQVGTETCSAKKPRQFLYSSFSSRWTWFSIDIP